MSIVHIFLEIQNDGYWEQDGNAWGERDRGGGKKGISRRARSHGKVFLSNDNVMAL